MISLLVPIIDLKISKLITDIPLRYICIFKRRTRMIPTTFYKSSLLATSTSATANMSSIPTGAFISPGTNYAVSAWFINPGGGTDFSNNNDVTGSYGLFSPGTYFIYGDGMSYRVDSSGNVDTVNDNVMQFRNVTDSYGIRRTQIVPTSLGKLILLVAHVISISDFPTGAKIAVHESRQLRLACLPLWRRRQQRLLRQRRFLRLIVYY